jgi:hypothetical protein
LIALVASANLIHEANSQSAYIASKLEKVVAAVGLLFESINMQWRSLLKCASQAISSLSALCSALIHAFP